MLENYATAYNFEWKYALDTYYLIIDQTNFMNRIYCILLFILIYAYTKIFQI